MAYKSITDECVEAGKDGYFKSRLETGSLNWTAGKILGEGAFGLVYEGFLESGQVVAVKEVLESDINQRNEIAILQELKHRNIVKYLGSHKEVIRVYIFTELIKGSSLRIILARQGPLVESTCCDYTEQVLQALKYIHHKGIIHRDVVPENVMVTPSGLVKLISFWCACKENLFNIPEPSELKYSMAPEILKEEYHNNKVDIWSLGYMVYIMATASHWGIAHSLESSNLSIPPRYSNDMKTFINRCIKIDPSERPNANQLLKDPFITNHMSMSDERAQEIIDSAMESGSIQQRNVVGIITGLMGSGKTTLLHHLFGLPPPGLYTSTGVAEQSIRGLLHHILHVSAGTWQRLSYTDVRQMLALFIKAGMKESDVGHLASCLMQDADPLASVSSQNHSSDTSLMSPPLVITDKSPSCMDMVPLVKSEATVLEPPEDPVLELVHMIDTGGQPELMEVMPSLVHNASIALVLVDLRFGLNEHPPVNSYKDGVPHHREKPSYYTCRDIVLKVASTLHARKNLNQSFHLLIVATHRDCVEEDLETRVSSLNTELTRLLIPDFEDQLILFEAPDKIAFVINLKDPEESDLKVLELIQTEIGKPSLGRTFETPSSFFVFEQDLLHFATNEVKRDILSLEECKKVGARLKMSEEVVKAALVLFNSQNTFLYFRHILPDHVFIKPQVPLDIINSIVQCSYRSLRGVPAKFVSMLKSATVTEELLNNENIISSHFKKGFYEVQHAIKLFCHTFIIAPLQSDDENRATPADPKKREYLMMCLKPAIPNDKLQQHIPKSTDTVPLVIKFSSGCVPLGCFGSTISCLISRYGWEIIRGAGNDPKCLAHNIASLFNRDLLVNILLVDYVKHIEIHVGSDLSILCDDPASVCSQVRSNVQVAIENVFAIMHIDLKVSLAVFCHNCPGSEQQHLAEIIPCKEKHFLHCELTRAIFKPNDRELLWVEINHRAQQAPMQRDTIIPGGPQWAIPSLPQSTTRLHSGPPLPHNLHTSQHLPTLSQFSLSQRTPTLPQLLCFPTKQGTTISIPERIGVNHLDFAIRLLNDSMGNKTKILEAECGPNPTRITMAILQRWLQGDGMKPITWTTLITVLKEIQLFALAEEIEQNLKP